MRLNHMKQVALTKAKRADNVAIYLAGRAQEAAERYGCAYQALVAAAQNGLDVRQLRQDLDVWRVRADMDARVASDAKRTRDESVFEYHVLAQAYVQGLYAEEKPIDCKPEFFRAAEETFQTVK